MLTVWQFGELRHLVQRWDHGSLWRVAVWVVAVGPLRRARQRNERAGEPLHAVVEDLGRGLAFLAIRILRPPVLCDLVELLGRGLEGARALGDWLQPHRSGTGRELIETFDELIRHADELEREHDSRAQLPQVAGVDL